MKTVGKILTNTREQKNLTLDDVYKFIKIHPKYLKALETDDYSIFQGKVHAKGFLKIYSDFLGLNTLDILALWRREYEAGFENSKEEKFFQLIPVSTSRFVVTPGVVGFAIISLLVILFFGYLFYQYKTFTGAPTLEIYHPQNNVVVDFDILDVTGKTDIDSGVFINNQRVILNPDGSFATSLKLKEGLNNFSIISINKLSKKTEVVRTVIFRSDNKKLQTPESSQSTESSQSIKGV